MKQRELTKLLETTKPYAVLNGCIGHRLERVHISAEPALYLAFENAWCRVEGDEGTHLREVLVYEPYHLTELLILGVLSEQQVLAYYQGREAIRGQEVEARERAEYERLHKKYGDKPLSRGNLP